MSRAVAFLVTGFVVLALGASCGSTAKSTKGVTTAAEGESPSSTSAAATPATDTTQAIASRKMYINVDAANVRGGPAKDQPIVAKLKFLDPVVATGTVKDDWVEIEVTSADGAMTRAWVHGSLLSASADQAKAAHGTP